VSIVQSLQSIGDSGLIVVMRGLDADLGVRASEVLYEAGVRVIEVTVDSPGALETIRVMSRSLAGKALFGAGTVLDEASAVAAISAGAQFLFAPNLNREVIAAALRYGRVAIPGVFTPTEMVSAAEWGAPAVKLFPANALGPDYVKQVRAPLPHIPIIPTGGVGENNVAEYVKAGAFAVGVGASLIGDLPQKGDWDELARRASTLVEKIKEARWNASS